MNKHSTTMRYIKTYYGDWAELSQRERDKILKDRPENIDLAIHDALVRHRRPAAHRELLDLLDASETLAKRSMAKIITTIPSEHIGPILARVESAMSFLTKINTKLQVNANKIDSATDQKKDH